MNDHLMKAGGDVILAKDGDQLSRPPHVYWWHRCDESVTMQLTNGTVQVCYKNICMIKKIKYGFDLFIHNIIFFFFF